MNRLISLILMVLISGPGSTQILSSTEANELSFKEVVGKITIVRRALAFKSSNSSIFAEDIRSQKGAMQTEVDWYSYVGHLLHRNLKLNFLNELTGGQLLRDLVNLRVPFYNKNRNISEDAVIEIILKHHSEQKKRIQF